MAISRRIVVLISLLIVFASAGGVIFVEANSEYSIEASSSIDTPTRTVTLEDTDYQVSSLGYSEEGTNLDVDVTTPEDEDFDVYLYNKDGHIMVTSETETLSTKSVEMGTYLLALSIDGVIETVQPVVISGYDFSVSAPDSVSENDSVTITIELTDDTELPSYVDVAVMNDSAYRYRADYQGNRVYEVNITDLSPDEYTLYAGARGDEQVNNRDELLGVSDAHSLHVTEPTTEEPESTTTTSESSGGSSGTNGGGDSSSPSETTTESEPTPTQSVTPTSTTTTATNSTTTAPPTTTAPQTTVEHTPTTTEANPQTTATESNTPTTDSEILTPGTPTTPDQTTTTAPVPQGTLVIAGLMTLLLWRTRTT